jgi:hypothetical protein
MRDPAEPRELSSSVPFDLLLLPLLVAAQILVPGMHFLLVVSLFSYIVLQRWHPLGRYKVLPERFGRTRLTFLIRLALLWMMIAGSAIYPTVKNIYNRAVSPVDESGISEAVLDVHDGALQVEYALAYLRDAKNPYVERYDNTPFEYYTLPGMETSVNPAVDYFVYLPGYLLISFPLSEIFGVVGLPYDQRWVYLFAFIALLLVMPALVNRPSLKLALLAAVGLNPLITVPLIWGMNDILVLLTIVIAVAALSRGHPLLSVATFALACSLKQSAWFIAPFYFLFLFHSLPPADRLREAVRYAVVALVIAVALIGPFALWSLSDFMTDVFAYPGGGVENNYPIRGFTVGVILLAAGVITSPLDPFPFWLLQLLVGLPLLLWLMRDQWRDNRPGTMLSNGAIFVFGLGLVSRFFNENYVGFVAVLFLIGVILNQREHTIHDQPAR